MGKEEQKQVGGELLMDEENKSDKEALSKIDFFFSLVVCDSVFRPIFLVMYIF